MVVFSFFLRICDDINNGLIVPHNCQVVRGVSRLCPWMDLAVGGKYLLKINTVFNFCSFRTLLNFTETRDFNNYFLFYILHICFQNLPQQSYSCSMICCDFFRSSFSKHLSQKNCFCEKFYNAALLFFISCQFKK